MKNFHHPRENFRYEKLLRYAFSEDIVTLTVEDIASDGLKYCYDHFELNTDDNGRNIFDSAVYNILTSQKFDAIPMMNNNNKVRKIARRRLHDGDRDNQVIYVDIDECATVSPKATIIESIFEILANEHHVLFVVDNSGQPHRILTISMLKSLIVRDYLNMKIARLSVNGWNWNQMTSDFKIDLSYGQRIYDEIVKLAELVDDDLGSLSPDFEVSTQIVKILQLLQPLKNSESCDNSEDFELSKFSSATKKLTVGELMSHPAATLTVPEDDIVLRYAYKFFAVQNNWDSVLLHNKETDTYEIITGISKDGLERQPIDRIAYDEPASSVIAHFINNRSKPMFSFKPDSIWPGIITVDDLALEPSYIMDIIVKFTDLEFRLRTFLLDAGVLHVRRETTSGNKTKDSIIRANWANLTKEIESLESNDIFKPEDFVILEKLRRFRNKVVHTYLPMIDDESRDFPKWMHNDFLSGMVYMIKSMGILDKFPSNKSLFNALNGLDALLKSKGLNAISKPSSGLVGFKLKSELDNLVIELTVKQSEFSRVKQMFDSFTEEEIKNWSNFEIEIISD